MSARWTAPATPPAELHLYRILSVARMRVDQARRRVEAAEDRYGRADPQTREYVDAREDVSTATRDLNRGIRWLARIEAELRAEPTASPLRRAISFGILWAGLVLLMVGIAIAIRFAPVVAGMIR